jgi:peptidyl-prolyl cis-trans isomerase SurA
MLALLLSLAVCGQSMVDKVVAVVADEPILHSEVVELLSGSGRRASPGEPAYMAALEEIVEEQLLLEAARQAGFYPTSEEVDEMVEARMDSVRAGMGGEAALQEALAASGLTMADFRRRTADIVAGSRAVSDYLRWQTSRVMSTLPTEPEGFLESHPDMVEEVAMPRRLSWIYLPVLPSLERCADAMDTLGAARERILAGESDFATEAGRLSEDASATRGGSLGLFGRGEMTPTFEEVAFSLDPGEVSRPFRTPFGVHVVRVDSVAGDTLSASHILIGVERRQSDVEAALDLADSLGAAYEAGADFASLASRHSLDLDTRDSGGSMGTVLVRGWMPEVADALEGVEPGGTGGPVVLPGGSAVALFLVESGGGGEVDFDEYSPTFLDELVRSVAYRMEYSSLIDSLRTEVPVLVYVGEEAP